MGTNPQFRSTREIAAKLDEDRKAIQAMWEFWAKVDTGDVADVIRSVMTTQGVSPSTADDLAQTLRSYVRGMRESLESATRSLGAAEHVVATSMPRAVRQARDAIAGANGFIVS